MLTEHFFDLLLEFGDDWVVKQVTTSVETNEIEISVVYFGEAKPYDYAPERRWRHLHILQFKTYIKARLPRFKSADGKVKTLSWPWANPHERHSFLFESAVIELLLAIQNQTRTAQLMGCTFDVVNRIMHQASQRGIERRQAKPEVFEHLSLDEKSFQKGHSYVSVLSHPQSDRVLEVVAQRTKQACQNLINDSLSEEQKSQVKTISMDMWPAFIATAQEQLPSAAVVHDKFHLIQYLYRTFENFRSAILFFHGKLDLSPLNCR